MKTLTKQNADSTATPGQYVYVLTAEVSSEGNDNYMEWQDGITAVHATLDGALEHFDTWLDGNGLDRDAAHYGQTVSDTFVGGDPDPDTFEDRSVLHWGINKTMVGA